LSPVSRTEAPSRKAKTSGRASTGSTNSSNSSSSSGSGNSSGREIPRPRDLPQYPWSAEQLRPYNLPPVELEPSPLMRLAAGWEAWLNWGEHVRSNLFGGEVPQEPASPQTSGPSAKKPSPVVAPTPPQPLGPMAATWEAVVSRVTCIGEDCRVAFDGGVGVMQDGVSSTWAAVLLKEGEFIYSLFRRQLKVFVPDFDNLQIEADFFMQRSFWLRHFHLSPMAFSILIPLAPPGLNFTRFYVSDIRVSWQNLFSLDQNPIVLDIESVRATAAECPAGNHTEVENMILDWLDISGTGPAPFSGKYPLLDGATFRIQTLDLDIISPKRYGNLHLHLGGVEVRAVTANGVQLDLRSLVKQGLHKGTITFSRLVECHMASVKYLSPNLEDRWDGLPPAGSEGEHFVLAPTKLAAMLTRRQLTKDLRQAVAQRWTLVFPAATRFLALPPLLCEAPELPPSDPRLCPFEEPPTEWRIHIAEEDALLDGPMFEGFKAIRPSMHPIAAVFFTAVSLGILLYICTHVRPRPWLHRLLSHFYGWNLLDKWFFSF